MKKFKCTVTKEINMEVEIDESVWTEEAIKEWSKSFYPADNLGGIVENIASMKSKYEDGEFIEGFGIPMVNGKKTYEYLNDNDIAKDININNQEESVDVDIEEICE